MPRKKNTEIALDWKPLEGVAGSYCLNRETSYWPKGNFWWASRSWGKNGSEEPFRRFRSEQAAKKWAEEPVRRAAEARMAARAAKACAKLEGQATRTWGRLKEDQRVLAAGQVWGMKNSKLAGSQILIVEVRSETAVVCVRKRSQPWIDATRDVRGTDDLLRLYRYLGLKGEPLDESLSEVVVISHVQSSREDLPVEEATRGQIRRKKNAATSVDVGLMQPLFA